MSRRRNISKRKTEEALQANEAVMQSFFESPGIMRGIVEVINEKDILHIQDNRVTASYMGLTPTDLRCKLSSELGSSTERIKAWLQHYRQSQTSGQPVTFEYLDRQGSKESWLQSTVSYLGVAPSGNPRFAYVAIDITERKKLEIRNEEYAKHLEEMVGNRTKEVQVERQRLYSVLETLPEMICLLTPDHHVIFANRSFRERFGESQGRHCYDYCFGNKEPCDFCESYKVLETGKPHHWEVSCPDGSVIDAHDFPFTDTDGSSLILEMDVDITEQKRLQTSLRSASQYARSLIEASLDPLVTISPEGKITDVNNATELATGRSRAQLIGSDFSDYFTEPDKARAGYQQVFAEGFVRDYPLAIKHISGKIIDVLYNASVFRNPQGEIQGVFAAARDITERKNAERQAEESARKLKEAERLAAIGATAGMIGHDIRNPLQSIIGNVDLLRMNLDLMSESPQKGEMQESLDDLEKQADYVNKIIADLQDYTRPLKPIFEEINLQIIINDLLKHLNTPSIIKTQICIDDLARKVTSDPAHIRRILGNLLLNSIQAMPGGGKLTVKVHEEPENTIVTIEDTGQGIPEEYRDRLFEPLFTTKSKGQGFGLAVAKRLTEALGGTITCDSQVGKGTRFIIRLPHRSIS